MMWVWFRTDNSTAASVANCPVSGGGSHESIGFVPPENWANAPEFVPRTLTSKCDYDDFYIKAVLVVGWC
jgi:hypothetical protein